MACASPRGAVRRVVDGGLAQIERGHRAPRGAGVSVAVRKAAALASLRGGGRSVARRRRRGDGRRRVFARRWWSSRRATHPRERTVGGGRSRGSGAGDVSFGDGTVCARGGAGREGHGHRGRGAPLGRGTRSCALARQGSVRIRRATRGGCGNPSTDARLAGRGVLVDREVVGTKEASRTNIPPRPSTSDNISARVARKPTSRRTRQFQLQASTIRRVDRRVRTRRRARL